VPGGLRPLEIASGRVTGDAPGLPLGAGGADPAQALRAATLDALRRPPCLVSFSGGTDSSLVLTAATQAARAHGLADPVPITWRFPHAPKTEESEWQEAVVAELGLADWVKRTGGDELDVIGPVALGVLREHGLLYPPNAFLHAPLVEAARGGTLLTGVGGDELLGRWRWRALADARAGRRRRTAVEAPWLRPDARAEVERADADEDAREPYRWDERVAWQARRRRLALSVAALDALATTAAVAHPLLDPGFLGALARAGGRDGFGDRRTILATVLAPVFPQALRDRDRKALFDEVFWTGKARAFAAEWDGRGVDTSLVDADVLRAQWQSDAPDPATALLLQSVVASRAA
jgi:hypothetical protein